MVGTQIDLRGDAATLVKLAKNKEKPLSFEMGKQLAEDVKAVKYVECSAFTQKELKNVFDEAILQVFDPPKIQCWYQKCCLPATVRSVSDGSDNKNLGIH